jgi:hypothetical protein
MEIEDLKNVGGTPGGMWEFLIGLGMGGRRSLYADKPRHRDEWVLGVGRL